MKKETKNYYGLYICVVVILLVLSGVIYNIADGYWKAFMYFPILMIIFLGILRNKLEDREEKRKSMGFKQQYQYPKK